MLNYEKTIVFICIGSNKIIGDCLGPLVGSYLKDRADFDVYGDMNNPVNFENAEHIMEEISCKYSNSLKILIDSALGDNVGDIIIDDGEIEIGKGLSKKKKICGDISIKAVVGKNYNDSFQNIEELRNKKIEEINEIAMNVVKMICDV